MVGVLGCPGAVLIVTRLRCPGDAYVQLCSQQVPVRALECASVVVWLHVVSVCASWCVWAVLAGQGEALRPAFPWHVPAGPWRWVATPLRPYEQSVMQVVCPLVLGPCGYVVPVVVAVLHGCGELQLGGRELWGSREMRLQLNKLLAP